MEVTVNLTELAVFKHTSTSSVSWMFEKVSGFCVANKKTRAYARAFLLSDCLADLPGGKYLQLVVSQGNSEVLQHLVATGLGPGAPSFEFSNLFFHRL